MNSRRFHSITSSARSWRFAIDRKAKPLRSLEIDDQLKFAWLLDWQIGRLRALQDLIDVGGSASKQIGQARAI